MILRTRLPRPIGQRSGVILMVVLSLLTLFAIVGLTFVFYADSSAASSDIALKAENQTRPDYDPEAAMSFFLGQIIYDLPDDATGVYSSFRGHSLARNMYGWFYPTDSNPGSPTFGQAVTPDGTLDPVSGLPKAYQVNFVDNPFNGTGRLHTTTMPPSPTNMQQWPTMSNFVNPANPNVPNPIDDFKIVNYTFFDTGSSTSGDFFFTDPKTGKPASRPLLRDPERYFPTVGVGASAGPRAATNGVVGTFTGGFNPSYTYPDNNALYLAAVSSDGTVLQPSYHRTDNTSGGGQLNAPGANWTQPVFGKYMTLRPNQDWHPNFSFPPETFGDVKNLFWTKGGNDSIWIDGDGPVLISQDGRKYKMMVAPLILDLDNRVNLNVVGNVLGFTQTKDPTTGKLIPQLYTQTSNQGWGPWEVNPGKLAPASLNLAQRTALENEMAQLFLGNPVFQAPTLINASPAASNPSRVVGRYGAAGLPTGRTITPGIGSLPHALVDFDGIWNTGLHQGLRYCHRQSQSNRESILFAWPKCQWPRLDELPLLRSLRLCQRFFRRDASRRRRDQSCHPPACLQRFESSPRQPSVADLQHRGDAAERRNE